MKIFKWIVGLMVIIIAALVPAVLNRKSPNVKYTLSKGIPITSFQKGDESVSDNKIVVQELVVKNLGNIKAEKVRVTIRGVIVKHGISKNFTSDNPEIIKHANKLSLLYPELPPDGNFTLVFSSIGAGIQEGMITVADQNGLCEPALSQTESFNFSSIFFFSLSIIYFVLILFTIILPLLRDDWKRRLKYKSYHEIISKKKPFYISIDSWDEAIDDALSEKIKYEYYSNNIQDSLPYKALNSDRPALVSNHVWVSFLEKCKKELESRFVNRMDHLIGENIIKLLQIKKPKHFSQSKWGEIQKHLGKKYILYKKVYVPFSTNEIFEEITKSQPSEINQEDWCEYINFLRKEYTIRVREQITFKNNPLSYLEEVHLDEALAKDDEKRALKEEAYNLMMQKTSNFFNHADAENFLKGEKPSWMKPDDYEELKVKAYNLMMQKTSNFFNCEIAKDFLESEKPDWMHVDDYEKLKNTAENVIKQFRFSKLFDFLNLIFSNQMLPFEKPDYLTERDWIIILDIEKRLKNKD